MRLVGDELCWSATDLTTAARCEHQLLRRLDVLLGRGEPPPDDADPLLQRVAEVGDLHEAQVAQRLRAEATRYVQLPRPRPGAGHDELTAMQRATTDALREPVGVVCQAGFYDGELVGFADFLVATPQGWSVCDAKLARQARPEALLQVAAYADQVRRAGLPLAPTARLLLGDGSGGADGDGYDVGDLLPVLEERRTRLRSLLARHRASPHPVRWGADDVVACGRCEWCRQAVEAHRDLLLVAGLRMSQRATLRRAGARTLDDLAEMAAAPDGLLTATFERLRAQARLQRSHPVGGVPAYEVVGDGSGLGRLPAPSPGDVFFDFEGDPLHREDDPPVWGLEYLWGVLEWGAPEQGGPDTTGGGLPGAPHYRRWWAHDHAEERRAFEEFMDHVAARRAAHPGMHVYHYAPYETAALKRLAGRHATRQDELDQLLRDAVFVDLYAVVRASVRVSLPSYGLKKLEPLFMGEQARTGMEVQAGDASVVEYHRARGLIAAGDAEAGRQVLAGIEDYNRYDCVATLRLRDWLLGLAEQRGVRPAPQPDPAAVAPEPPEPDQRAADRATDRATDRAELQALVDALRARSGPACRAERTPDEQAYAMLASALGFHRRESLPFWWEHFARLAVDDVEQWRPDRDVFRVDETEVVDPWHVPEGARTMARRLRLRGRWAPGSTPGSQATVVYRTPCPEGTTVPETCGYGWRGEAEIAVSPLDEGEVLLTERLRREQAPYDAVPVALGPPPPPRDGLLRQALRELAEQVRERPDLPVQPGVEVLRRRPPRTAGGRSLPHTGDVVGDLVAALLDADRSYVPVQGPPGTGKTWTGSRVVRRLVEEHGWRVGVVAQSHAAVENLLAALCRAGLDPALVGKPGTQARDAAWTGLTNATTAPFLADHEDTGCVLGGTAWTFSNERNVAREALDLLVVDEAGQYSLATTVAVSVAARRLLLLGDPQQLPQVSQGTHDEPVHVSALRWVMGEADTLPRELGYFLDTTYRMHPSLCAQVSVLSYDGELASAPVTTLRTLAGVAPGVHTVLVEGSSESPVASDEEADVVLDLVTDLLGRDWHDPSAGADHRRLDGRDVLVVAPYNAQVALLRRRLHAAGLDEVRVGTVDRFQGQEAPVVVVSMTAPRPADVPRGMGFLLDRNRVNVAVSRAQWCTYVVRSHALTGYLPRSPRGVLELGAFIRLSPTDLSGGASSSPSRRRWWR